MSGETFGMCLVWIIFLGAIFLPFWIAFFAALKGQNVQPSRSSASDNENKQTALLKQQVDLLDKNRRELD